MRVKERPEWTPGPSVPRTSGVILERLGKLALRISGWRIVGSLPDLPRFVIVVAPHTSNWDFVVGLVAKWAMKLKVRFIGKHTLFRPPLGWFMRAIGGIPVDRSTHNNLVDESVKAFASNEQLVLVIAPEGTRKAVTGWKAGFWHIAHAAGVPVCCGMLDYGEKEIRLGPVVEAVGPDAAYAVEEIRTLFRGVKGRHARP